MDDSGQVHQYTLAALKPKQ